MIVVSNTGSISDLVVDLRRIRKIKGLSQGEVAEKMGSTPTQVCNIEKRGANIRTDTLAKYLDAVGVKLRYEIEVE